MKLEDLKGRGAVVTGGGAGMGRSMAHTLADAGMRVVVADINAAAAQSVADEIVAAGGQAIAVPTDVSSLEAVQHLADTAYDTYGDIAVLINNAGVTWRPYRAHWDADISDYRWLMGINFFGVLHGHLAFVPRMRQTATPKHIVNTSSLATQIIMPGHTAYTAAKFAVDGFTDVVREEFRVAGDPISITLFFPGVVKTNIGATSEKMRPEAERAETRKVIPWTHYAAPDYQAIGGETKQTRDAAKISDPMEAMEPDAVGPMVLDAILENRAYLSTHPVPREVRRGGALNDAFDARTEIKEA